MQVMKEGFERDISGQLIHLNETADNINRTTSKILEIMPKMPTKLDKAVGGAVAAVGILGVLGIVDILIKWILGG
jgi:hypothetical protein